MRAHSDSVLVLDLSGPGGSFTTLPNSPESRRVNYNVRLKAGEDPYLVWMAEEERAQLDACDYLPDWDRLPIRLRVLYEIVSSAIELDIGPSGAALRTAVAGRNPDVDAAREELVAEEIIERQPGRNGGSSYWPSGFILSDSTEPADWYKRPKEPEVVVPFDPELDKLLSEIDALISAALSA